MSLANLKGQGATEYLVLLAVVLIIALVSIALLSFFPGLALDAKITQSNAYWSGEAQPFAIRDESDNGTMMTLVLENMDATGGLTLTNITLSSISEGTDWNDTRIDFSSGDTQTVVVGNYGGFVATPCNPGQGYDFNVTIQYQSDTTGIPNTQWGSKDLIGKCSGS
jgi:hypothetical protein